MSAMSPRPSSRRLRQRRPSAGKTFELGGPQVLTIRELLRCASPTRSAAIRHLFVELPDFVARRSLASGFGWAPFAPITKDQWLMLQHDNVVAGDASGLAELGIAPTSLAAVADGWLVQYRRHGRFAQTA
jgi:hypothetical protein